MNVTKLKTPEHHISSGMYSLAASHRDNVEGEGQDVVEHRDDDDGHGGPGRPPG